MIGFGLINGLKFGIEHVTGDEEDVFESMIEVDFAFLRFVWMKLKDGFEVEE